MKLVKFTQNFGPFRTGQVATENYVALRINELGLSTLNLSRCIKYLEPNRFKTDADDSIKADDHFVMALRQGVKVMVGARVVLVYSLRELTKEFKVIGLTLSDDFLSELVFSFMVSSEMQTDIPYNGVDTKANFVTLEKLSVYKPDQESILETLIDNIDKSEERFIHIDKEISNFLNAASVSETAKLQLNGADFLCTLLTGKNLTEIINLNKQKNEQ
jgi:hypothetical protein